MSSKLQSDGCYYYSQWWRRLVNAYEVKAGMVFAVQQLCGPYLGASEVSFSRWGAIKKVSK